MKYAREYGRSKILENSMQFKEGWIDLIYSKHALERLKERLKGDVELYPKHINISKLNISRGYSYDGKHLHKVVIRLEFKRTEWIYLVILPSKRLVKSLWFQDKNMKLKPETEEQWKLFQELWAKLPVPRKCWSCDKPVYGTNKPLYWDHLLEKNKYPDLRLEPKNLFFCCGDCHQKKNMGWPTAKHKEAIEQAKQIFLN
jgi:hypothetical protein